MLLGANGQHQVFCIWCSFWEKYKIKPKAYEGGVRCVEILNPNHIFLGANGKH